MSLFKERRVKLLLFVVFLSVMLIWRPWAELEPQARGLNFSVDIVGGSRVVMLLEVSHVTIAPATDDLDSAWDSIRAAIEDELNTTVNLVAKYPTENRIVVEVGMYVIQPFIQGIIGGSGTVVDIQNAGTQNTLENVISKLQARVDPYDLSGTRFRTLGENHVLFETSYFDDRTRELLIKEGRLELFIENELVLTDSDIERFESPVAAGLAYSSIHISYTEEGKLKLQTASEGKTGLPGVVYMDRPSDAILLFDESTLNELSKLTYDNIARTFTYTTTEYTGAELQYPLLVPAVGTSVDNLSPQAIEYLEGQVGIKQRVILLGSTEDFASVIGDIPASYRIESVPRSGNEASDKWVKRAFGVISDFPINIGVGSNRIIVGTNIENARDLRKIMSNKSPAGLSFAGETQLEPRLGPEFMQEALLAAAAAVIGMSILIYHRYRRWKICPVFIGFIACEKLMTLGGVSVLGSASFFGLTFGLPELGGLLVVIGTGINYMLLTTDEMLFGKESGATGAGWRASRLLPLIYISIFVMLAAAVPIAAVGFGALRGFATVTIVGLVFAFLFTRPIYGKVIDAILAAERTSTV